MATCSTEAGSRRQGGRGISTVRAECFIPRAPKTVWRVLSDYESLDEFVPFLTSSELKSSGDGSVHLRQSGRGKLWFFGKRFEVTFNLHEEPMQGIRFNAIEGSFAVFDGFWKIEPRDGGCLVRHEVNIAPTFFVPGWVLRHLARRMMDESLVAVIDRCLKAGD